MRDDSTFPDEPEILRRFIEFRLADLHTAMPGEIVSFDRARNTAFIQPSLGVVFQDATGEETASPASVLEDVPVLFPRGGGMRMTWHPMPGDVVLLLFVERSIDGWMQSGGVVDPRPRRKHDWSDAVAIAGLAPLSDPITGIEPGQMAIGAEDGSVQLVLDRASGRVVVNGLSVFLAGAEGQPVGRVGDAVEIDVTAPENTTFAAWIAAVSSAGPGVVPAYTGKIFGKISTGSPKVSAE